MIDTHCHLYSKEFEKDIDAVIARAKNAGVSKFYLPAIDSSTHSDMMLLEEKFRGACFSMIGLHPCSVKSDFKKELDAVEELLAKRKFAAIGEAGLDFYWDTSFKNEQYAALEYQIELALKHHLPLILHTRSATKETIEVVKRHGSTGLKGIFHCFGGTVEEARQIISCNFMLGIGGVVTYKNSGLDGVLPHIDLEHLVLETDAPYLSPVPHRGKRNESAYLTEIVKKIAVIKNTTDEEVREKTTANAERLFNSN
jgi:TatD DNase family protein